MLFDPFVDHPAGVGVVSIEDFQHVAVVAQVVLNLALDRFWVGDVAEERIHETAKWRVLWLVWESVGLALDVGNLLFEDHAVNLELLVSSGGEIGGFLAEPFHFELEHFSQVALGVCGVKALHPDLPLLLEERVGLEVGVEGFGELFEERFQVASFGFLQGEACLLLRDLSFGGFAT